MKKNNSGFGGIITRILSLVMVFALAFTFASPITASAKVKNKTLKTLNNPEMSVSYAEAHSSSVKKGNYNFKIKKKKYFGRAFVKFTAPASKTYTFTVSNLRSSNGRYANGFFHVYRRDPNPRYDNFESGDKAKFFATKQNGEFKKKNTIKKYLNEGESAYIYFSSDGVSAKFVTFNFTIK